LIAPFAFAKARNHAVRRPSPKRLQVGREEVPRYGKPMREVTARARETEMSETSRVAPFAKDVCES